MVKASKEAHGSVTTSIVYITLGENHGNIHRYFMGPNKELRILWAKYIESIASYQVNSQPLFCPKYSRFVYPLLR